MDGHIDNAFNINTIFDLFAMNMFDYDYHGDAAPVACYTAQESFELAKTSKQKVAYQINQTHCQTMKMIGRLIKETHALYICPEQQWHDKVNQYLQLTDVFSYIGPMPSVTSNNEHVQNVLEKMRNEIIQTLDDLYTSQAITHEQYQSMIYFKELTLFEINKLDFIIELNQNEMLLQPTITCSAQEPMKSIVHFINNLLQPCIDAMIHSHTSLSTGYEVIQALEKYAQQGYLQSTTRFVKIDLHHIYTTLSHPQLIQALQKFLHQTTFHGKQHFNTTTITTIIRLVQLILNNQFCVYENNLYQQTMGGTSASSLLIGLIDIYLFDLFHDLHLILMKKNELFGRSSNHIIFTWNQSVDELDTLLTQINLQQHLKTIPIQMTISTDEKIQYLDTQISYYEGRLKTKVHHHAILEPDAVPYITGTIHDRSYAILLRAAYIRAFLYCSDVIEFEAERMYIECSFRNNDQSFEWIEQIFHDLLIEFQQTSTTEIDRAWLNETTYHLLRMRIRKYQEKQMKNQQHRRRRQRQQRQPRKKKFSLLKN